MHRVLVYVQHLLGIGHLHRTSLITRALAGGGFDVTVVSGGVPEASVDFGSVKFIQLEPIKTDHEFGALYDKSGRVIDDKFRRMRKTRLIGIVNQAQPKLVLIETYPFGRRQMRFELLPLLEHLRHTAEFRPIVASSIRDVIQPKTNPARIREVLSVVDKYFDLIIVHGDETFITFEESFPEADNFKAKIIYSGYVVKSLNQESGRNRIENSILVSAGGGAVGEKIYTTVLDASRSRLGKNFQWHMLVGNNFADAEFNALLDCQHPKLKIERNREDFLQLLSRCSLSISQAGYNTMMDLLLTNTPALVVPFEGIAEREQLIRASLFEQHGCVKLLREHELGSERLMQAIDEVAGRPVSGLKIKMDGAQRMVDILKSKIHS